MNMDPSSPQEIQIATVVPQRKRRYVSVRRVRKPADLLKEQQKLRQRGIRNRMKELYLALAETLKLPNVASSKSILELSIQTICQQQHQIEAYSKHCQGTFVPPPCTFKHPALLNTHKGDPEDDSETDENESEDEKSPKKKFKSESAPVAGPKKGDKAETAANKDKATKKTNRNEKSKRSKKDSQTEPQDLELPPPPAMVREPLRMFNTDSLFSAVFRDNNSCPPNHHSTNSQSQAALLPFNKCSQFLNDVNDTNSLSGLASREWVDLVDGYEKSSMSVH